MTVPATPNGHVPWNEKLLQAFEPSDINLRPQIWCPACRKADNRCCGKGEGKQQHRIEKCPDCGQKMTTAHLHLSYVGHADLTKRLLEADPKWTWEPLYREIDTDVLQSAISTGDAEIVKLVLASFPPKLTELAIPDGKGGTRLEYGMWIRLIVHDDDGHPVEMIGFGDAKGKAWGGDALKEVIGDALRNAGMRRGAALDLWRKQDLEQARRETRAQTPEGASIGALFDDSPADAPAIGSGTPPAVDDQVQAWADQAWTCARQGMTADQLAAAARDPAARAHKLGAWARPPWDPAPDARVRLSEVFSRAKKICDGKETFPAETAES